MHFKAILLSLFLLLLQFFGNVHAQKSSLLWKITSPDLENESFLFGTIHIICEEDFKMDERLQSAFESSGKLVMEIDMGDPQMMSEMQKASVNKNSANLKSDFSDADAAKIDAFLINNYGAGLDQFGILKPFVLSSMILMKTLPCESHKSYEMYFTTEAQKRNKSVSGLETVSYQVGIFDSIPKQLQLDEIVKLIDGDVASDEFNRMSAAYVLEDLDKLYALVTENEMFQEYGDILLTNRNKNWIPLIINEIKKQSTFIAVGAGHLSSETGLIHLLREAGLTVEPVEMEEPVLN